MPKIANEPRDPRTFLPTSNHEHNSRQPLSEVSAVLMAGKCEEGTLRHIEASLFREATGSVADSHLNNPAVSETQPPSIHVKVISITTQKCFAASIVYQLGLSDSVSKQHIGQFRFWSGSGIGLLLADFNLYLV